jgi:hypothetical protein
LNEDVGTDLLVIPAFRVGLARVQQLLLPLGKEAPVLLELGHLRLSCSQSRLRRMLGRRGLRELPLEGREGKMGGEKVRFLEALGRCEVRICRRNDALFFQFVIIGFHY